MPTTPDELRSAEARLRALTREVGTLREDLKREIKRRERAVLQAKEADFQKNKEQDACKELTYINQRLTQELDIAKQLAQKNADRDRKLLQTLRQDLLKVEKIVAQRASSAATLLQQTISKISPCKQCLQKLYVRVPANDQSLVQDIDNYFSDFVQNLYLLLKQFNSPDQALKDALENHAELDENSDDISDALDSEKLRLKQEVQRLQNQLTNILEKQTLLKNSASNLASSVKSEAHAEEHFAHQNSSSVLELTSMLDAEKQAKQKAEKQLRDMEIQLEERNRALARITGSRQEHDVAKDALIRELESSKRQLENQIASQASAAEGLQRSVAELQHYCSALESQLQEREAALSSQTTQLRSLQENITDQQLDIRTALKLVSQRDATSASTHPNMLPSAARAENSSSHAIGATGRSHILGTTDPRRNSEQYLVNPSLNAQAEHSNGYDTGATGRSHIPAIADPLSSPARAGQPHNYYTGALGRPYALATTDLPSSPARADQSRSHYTGEAGRLHTLSTANTFPASFREPIPPDLSSHIRTQSTAQPYYKAAYSSTPSPGQDFLLSTSLRPHSASNPTLYHRPLTTDPQRAVSPLLSSKQPARQAYIHRGPNTIDMAPTLSLASLSNLSSHHANADPQQRAALVESNPSGLYPRPGSEFVPIQHTSRDHQKLHNGSFDSGQSRYHRHDEPVPSLEQAVWTGRNRLTAIPSRSSKYGQQASSNSAFAASNSTHEMHRSNTVPTDMTGATSLRQAGIAASRSSAHEIVSNGMSSMLYGQRQQNSAGLRRGTSDTEQMQALQRDMQDLDRDIAQLEASLRTTVARLD